MKWFKVETTILGNPKISILIRKFGMEGFGVYIGILSLIGNNIKPNIQKKQYGYLPDYISQEDLSDIFKLSSETLSEILIFMTKNLKLFCEKKYFEENLIYCPNILEYADEYSKRWIQKPKSKNKNDGQTTDNIRSKSDLSSKSIRSEEEEESEEELIDKSINNICASKNSALKKPKKNIPAKTENEKTNIDKNDKSDEPVKTEKSEYRQATDYFCKKYLETYGVKYDFKDTVDGPIFSRLWKGALGKDLSLWKKVVDFALQGDFYANKNGGITIGIISAHINIIIPKVKGTSGNGRLKNTVGANDVPEKYKCSLTQEELDAIPDYDETTAPF